MLPKLCKYKAAGWISYRPARGIEAVLKVIMDKRRILYDVEAVEHA
jgi:hypothetical protein